jgi:hypothetical protein
MNKPFSQYLKSTELTELEVINDNDRIQRFIETPKSTTYKQVITYNNQVQPCI